MSMLAEALSFLDSMLAPITPAGVTGTQFITVFLLVYAIIFLMSSAVKIGPLKDNKAVRFILSIVVAYFTASSAFSVILITKLFPNLGVVTTALISFIIVIWMVPTKKHRLTMAPLLTIGGVIMIIYLTWTAMAGSFNIQGISLPQLSRTEWYGIIFLGIFGLIILAIFSTGKKGDKPGGPKDRWKWLKYLMAPEDDD